MPPDCDRRPLSSQQSIDEQFQALLSRYGLTAAPPDHIDALAGSVRRVRRKSRRTKLLLNSRERAQVLACIRMLLRHLETPPRRPGPTDNKRQKLIGLLDHLVVVVQLAAVGLSAGPIIFRLKNNTQTADDLITLQHAVDAIPRGRGDMARADFMPLLRGGKLIWKACGRHDGYTFTEYTDPPQLQGFFPDFLRDLIRLSGANMPSDNTLHTHLVSLKNL